MSDSGRTDIAFFTETGKAWDALYEDCAAATQSIDIEQYIFTDDAVGQRFFQLFAEKARQGVRVRLLLDGIGSRSLLASKTLLKLRDAGVCVKFYNTIGWRKLFTPSKWLPRNHNKVMLVDSKIAHISSAGLWHVMKDWRELHARFTGQLADTVEEYFTKLWEKGGRRRYRVKMAAPDPAAPYRFVISQPHLRRGQVYKELLNQIKHAKKHVYLVSPYFLPPLRLRRALKKAVKRGVDVRVIVSEKTDVPLADCVSRSYFPALLRKRLRLFLFRPNVLHAKYVSIDGAWATIGSTNLDYLSLLRNREANVIIRDPEAVARLEAIFHETQQGCRAFDKDYWRRLPLYYKIIGYLGHAVRGVL